MTLITMQYNLEYKRTGGNKMDSLQLKNIISSFVDNLSNVLTLDVIKGLNGWALDFDTFHFVVASKNVIGISKKGKGFLEDDFIDILQLQLSDNSMIEVALFHESFNRYSFLKDNDINIDTVECLNILQDMVKDKRFITNFQISSPCCMEFDEKEYLPKQLSINALECGGFGQVDMV